MSWYMSSLLTTKKHVFVAKWNAGAAYGRRGIFSGSHCHNIWRLQSWTRNRQWKEHLFATEQQSICTCLGILVRFRRTWGSDRIRLRTTILQRQSNYLFPKSSKNSLGKLSRRMLFSPWIHSVSFIKELTKTLLYSQGMLHLPFCVYSSSISYVSISCWTRFAL